MHSYFDDLVKGGGIGHQKACFFILFDTLLLTRKLIQFKKPLKSSDKLVREKMILIRGG